MKAKSIYAASLAFLLFAGVARAQDQMPEMESDVPGQVQLVRWDALLNQGGADAVTKVAVPIQTTSKVYQGYSCSGYELRQAVADAMANNGVEGIARQLTIGQEWTGNNLNLSLPALYFNYFDTAKPRGPRLNGSVGLTADTFSRQAKDQLHVKLNESVFVVQISEGQRYTEVKSDPAPSIDYEGDLVAGDAVAFMWPITAPSKTVYYQLSVWETFKALPALMQIVPQVQRDSSWWCKNGPSALRKMVGVAAIWQAQATHAAEDVPAEFVRKLDDGKEICLVALGRPDQAPLCWWDGNGQPVSDTQPLPDDNVTKGLQAIVELRGSQIESRDRSPTTRPGNVTDMAGMARTSDGLLNLTQRIVKVPDANPRLELGVTIGPWKELAQLQIRDQKEINGITYTVQLSQVRHPPQPPQPPTFFLSQRQTGPTANEDVTSISPVGPDGSDATFTASQNPNYDLVLLRRGAQTKFVFEYQFQGFAIDDVKYVRLCQRMRQWVTFEKIPTQPVTAIKTDFTPDELAAAAKAQQEKAQQEINKTLAPMQRALRQVQSHQWSAITPDPNTAMGTLRILVDAAGRGDEKTVRDLLIAKTADENATLDFFAQLMTVTQSNWAEAVKIFGEERAIAELDDPAIVDHGALFIASTWDRQPDGTWIGSCNVTLRKDSAGHYQVDLEPLIQAQKDSMAQNQQTLAQALRLAGVLDQPNVTIEQVKAALAPPAR